MSVPANLGSSASLLPIGVTIRYLDRGTGMARVSVPQPLAAHEPQAIAVDPPIVNRSRISAPRIEAGASPSVYPERDRPTQQAAQRQLPDLQRGRDRAGRRQASGIVAPQDTVRPRRLEPHDDRHPVERSRQVKAAVGRPGHQQLIRHKCGIGAGGSARCPHP